MNMRVDSDAGAYRPQPANGGGEIRVPSREIDRVTAIEVLGLLREQGHGAAAAPQTYTMFTHSQDAYSADEAFVQAGLVALGVQPPPGPIDGWFGPETAASVAAFQQAAGLEPTGEMDPATWQALQSALDTGEIPQVDPAAATQPQAEPGSTEFTDQAVAAAAVAWDSAMITGDSSDSHYSCRINGPLDDAVEAEFNRWVDERGMTPDEAREAMANRFNPGSRSDQLMEAALSRLVNSGRIELPEASAPATAESGETQFLDAGENAPLISGGPVATAH